MDTLEVVLVPALTDNYIFLAHHAESATSFVVDSGEAGPVLAEASRRGWRVTHILNTHWHGDHTGGNAAVKAATGAEIVGPALEAAKIPTLDRSVRGGDMLAIGPLTARVIDTPGHTAGHIAFHFADSQVVFVGDTLFALGCGRLSEGTAAEMHASLAALMTLPDETTVYCAHEYTAANARFALTVETRNAALASRAAEIAVSRASDRPTVPTTIALERATNPFVRATSVDEFARLRSAKDAFRG